MQVHLCIYVFLTSSHVVIVRGKNHKKPLSVELEIWISYLFFSPWVFNHFNILCGNFNIANFEYILTFRDKPSNFDSLLMKVYSKLIWWLMRLADDWLGKELISSSRFSHWAIILICCNFFQIFFFFLFCTQVNLMGAQCIISGPYFIILIMGCSSWTIYQKLDSSFQRHLQASLAHLDCEKGRYKQLAWLGLAWLYKQLAWHTRIVKRVQGRSNINFKCRLLFL